MNTTVRKATLLLMLLAVSATVTSVLAAEGAPSSRYIVVLKSGTSGVAGVTDAEVATLGGRIEVRLPTRLEITLSERSAEMLRNYPAVKYLQRVSTDGRSAEETSDGQSSIMRLHPQTMVVDPPSWTSGTFRYDGSGNIYTIGVSGESGVTTHTYTYDELSRLKQATNVATQTEKFQFDEYGNMTQHDVGSTSTVIALDPAHNNRLQTTATVLYDSVGNLISDDTASYTYDPFSQLREKDFSGSTDSEVYLYTAGDERIGVKQNDTWMWSIRDFGGKVLRQYQSSATQPSASWLWMEDYVYRDGLLLGADRPTEEGGRRYMHLDHLGTPRLITGANGVKVAEHELAPFGIEPTPLWEDTTHGFDREDPMRFTGHERDFAQISRMVTTPYLDYMHARYYSVSVGRFLSPDPVLGDRRSPQSWNRYTYVKNNPMGWADPGGLDCQSVTIKGEGTQTNCSGDGINDSSGWAEFFNRGYQLISGGSNAYASDLLLGVGRVNSRDPFYQVGQIGGDLSAMGQGFEEMLVGTNGELAGIVADLTPGGQLIGVPVNVVSAGVAAHGGATTAVSSWNLMSGIKQRKDGSLGQFKGADAKGRENRQVSDAMRASGHGNDPSKQREIHDALQGQPKMTFKELKQFIIDYFGR